MCGDFAGFKVLGHQADVIASSKVVQMYIHQFSLFLFFFLVLLENYGSGAWEFNSGLGGTLWDYFVSLCF